MKIITDMVVSEGGLTTPVEGRQIRTPVKPMYIPEIKEWEENLLLRLHALATSRIEQRTCPYYQTCNFVAEQINAVNLTIPEANGYITLVCEKYPDACELNLEEKIK